MKSDVHYPSTRSSRPRTAPRPVHPFALEDVALTKSELLAARQRDAWIVLPH
jgi:hypothetical protein